MQQIDKLWNLWKMPMVEYKYWGEEEDSRKSVLCVSWEFHKNQNDEWKD